MREQLGLSEQQVVMYFWSLFEKFTLLKTSTICTYINLSFSWEWESKGNLSTISIALCPIVRFVWVIWRFKQMFISVPSFCHFSPHSSSWSHTGLSVPQMCWAFPCLWPFHTLFPLLGMFSLLPSLTWLTLTVLAASSLNVISSGLFSPVPWSYLFSSSSHFVFEFCVALIILLWYIYLTILFCLFNVCLLHLVVGSTRIGLKM